MVEVRDDVSAVVLRSMLPVDHGVLSALRADTITQHLLLAHPEAARNDVAAWLQRKQMDAGCHFAVVADSRNDQALGFVQVDAIHGHDRYGYVGVAIASEQRGKGFGRAAMVRLVQAARDELGLRKLLLNVRQDNNAALNLYRAVGFDVVGIMRRHYNDGYSCHDVVLLERLLDCAEVP